MYIQRTVLLLQLLSLSPSMATSIDVIRGVSVEFVEKLFGGPLATQFMSSLG